MKDHPKENSFDQAIRLLRILRSKEGCPWNQAQNFRSLKHYLIEESYETLEALNGIISPTNKNQNSEASGHRLCEELGDLLLQVFFLGMVAEENGLFSIDQIPETLSEKLIRRHPHVFNPKPHQPQPKTPEEVSHLWEKIKFQEKSPKGIISKNASSTALEGIPAILPALQKAQTVGMKAAAFGFDWPNEGEVLEKVYEELTELKSVLNQKKDPEYSNGKIHDQMFHEMGDVFFSLANLSRFLGFSAEESLQQCIERFRNRFAWMENSLQKRGLSWEKATRPILEDLWIQAKKKLEEKT